MFHGGSWLPLETVKVKADGEVTKEEGVKDGKDKTKEMAKHEMARSPEVPSQMAKGRVMVRSPEMKSLFAATSCRSLAAKRVRNAHFHMNGKGCQSKAVAGIVAHHNI